MAPAAGALAGLVGAGGVGSFAARGVLAVLVPVPVAGNVALVTPGNTLWVESSRLLASVGVAQETASVAHKNTRHHARRALRRHFARIPCQPGELCFISSISTYLPGPSHDAEQQNQSQIQPGCLPAKRQEIIPKKRAGSKWLSRQPLEAAITPEGRHDFRQDGIGRW